MINAFTEGCFITSLDPEEVAEKINNAMYFTQRTKGKELIRELGLDSEGTANKIIEIYKKVLTKK